MGTRYWVAAVVVAINALTSLGFSLVVVLDTSLSGTGIGHTAALYALARSLPLAVSVLWAIAVRSRIALIALGYTMALVQVIDATIGDGMPKVLGPLMFAIVTLIAVTLLWREPARTGRTAA